MKERNNHDDYYDRQEAFLKNCGEHVSKVENSFMDDLWCKFVKIRSDPEATRTETNTAGNEFVKEFNRLGVSVDNSEDEQNNTR